MKKIINILLLSFYIIFSVGFTITNHLCKCETKVIEKVTLHSCCTEEKEDEHCNEDSDSCCESEDCCSDETIDIKIEDLYLVDSKNIIFYVDVIIFNNINEIEEVSTKYYNNSFLEKPSRNEKLFILNCSYLI